MPPGEALMSISRVQPTEKRQRLTRKALSSMLLYEFMNKEPCYEDAPRISGVS